MLLPGDNNMNSASVQLDSTAGGTAIRAALLSKLHIIMSQLTFCTRL